MPDTLDPERIAEVIDICLDEIDRLTKWEQGFIASLSDQWEQRHRLSDRQKEILERIYVEKVP